MSKGPRDSESMDTQTTKSKFSAINTSPEKENKRLRSSKQLSEHSKEPARQNPESTSVMDELKKALTPLQAAIEDLTSKVTTVNTSLHKIIDRLELVEDRSKSNELEIKYMTESLQEKDKAIKSIQSKLVDLEARSRRNNLIIRGLNEKYEHNQLTEVATQIFKSLCKETDSVHNFSIERAHRALRSQQAASTPRPVYIKMLHFQDVQLILSTFKKNNRFTWNNQHLIITQDLPFEIREMRRKLAPYCADLIQKKIKFQMKFPSTLSFTHQDLKLSVSSPNEARAVFLKYFGTDPSK